MRSRTFRGLCLAVASLFFFGSGPSAFATSPDISVKETSLGQIVVDSKGMTAYYYDLDVPNSGVSSCTGGCLVHWPIITAASATPVVSGIDAKVTVIASSNQIEINGRPIYTFAADTAPGDTRGQGAGGVWYVISPAGVELTPAALASKAAPSPAASHETSMPTSSASPSGSSKPKVISTNKVTKKAKAKITKKVPTKPAKKVATSRGNY